VTKADYLLRIKHQEPSTDEIVIEPITVRVFGSTAIVAGSYRETQRKAGTHTVTRWRFVDTWAYKKYGWVLNACPGLEKFAVITSLSFSSLFSGYTDDFHGAQQSRRHQLGIRLVEFRRRKGIGLRNIGLTVANDAVDPRVRDFDLNCVLPRF